MAYEHQTLNKGAVREVSMGDILNLDALIEGFAKRVAADVAGLRQASAGMSVRMPDVRELN